MSGRPTPPPVYHRRLATASGRSVIGRVRLWGADHGSRSLPSGRLRVAATPHQLIVEEFNPHIAVNSHLTREPRVAKPIG